LLGLYNYFTAPNIRHKVKHPIFLIIKFTQCVSLYYNEGYFLKQKIEIDTKNLLI